MALSLAPIIGISATVPNNPATFARHRRRLRWGHDAHRAHCTSGIVDPGLCRRTRRGCCGRGQPRCGATAARYGLPDLSGQQLLARQGRHAARRRVLAAVVGEHGLRSLAAPRLRPVVRVGAVRDTDHDRARCRTSAGAVRVRRRERPRALSAVGHDTHRGRPGRRRGPARDRRRCGFMHPVRDVEHPPDRVRLDGRFWAPSGRCAPTSCARSRGRQPTPQDFRSCPGCCGGQRCALGGSITPSGSRPTSRRVPTCGQRATRPAPARTRPSRRWAPGSD